MSTEDYTAQLVIAQSHPAPYRCNSSLLTSYPWRNGVVLERESLYSWVVNHEPPYSDPLLTHIIKSLSFAIDVFDKDGFFQHPYRNHAWSLLTGKPSKATFSGQSGYFGHLMLGYQLIDALLWSSSWISHAALSVIERRPTPLLMPRKLLAIVKALGNWPDLISKARKARRDEPHTTTSWIPSDVQSAEDITYAIAMKNLQHGITHYRASHWHHILMNIHSVAFIVRWHSPLNLQASKPADSFLKQFLSRAGNANINITPNLHQVPIDRMVNLTQVALSLSPLVLLMSQWGVSESFSRDVLIEYAVSLGTKPPALGSLEAKIWRVVCSVATGGDSSVGMSEIFKEFDDIVTSGKPLIFDWFSQEYTNRVTNRSLSASSALQLRIPRTQDDHPTNGASLHVYHTSIDELSLLPSPHSSGVNMSKLSIAACSNDVVKERISQRRDVIHRENNTAGSNIREDQGSNPALASDTDFGGSDGPTTDSPSSLSSCGWDSSSSTRIVQDRQEEAERERENLDQTTSSTLGGGQDEVTTLQGGCRRNDCATRSVFGQSCRKMNKRHRKASSRNQRGPDEPTAQGSKTFPIYVDLDGDAFQEHNLFEKPPSVLSDDKISLKLWLPRHLSPQVLYDFRSPKSVAGCEYPLLRDIQTSVEALYVDGRPLYHRDSARSLWFNANDPYQSSIFVVEYDAFVKMRTGTLQEVFKHRHILVLNSPSEKQDFSLESLSKLGSIDKVRPIQDIQLRTKENPQVCMRGGTLAEFYEESTKGSNGKILNVLDLPMGAIDVSDTVQYTSLASNQMAWQQTRGQKGLVRENPPSDELIWGTTALAGATSWVHINANGLGAYVNNVAGAKYWVLLNRRRGASRDNPCGDMSSPEAFPDSWKAWSSGCGVFEHEGILLTPGCLFFMRPNTPHYVLTLGHSITYGRYFYATSTIRDTCWAIVHCTIGNNTLTHTEHPRTTQLLRRILLWSLQDYERTVYESSQSNTERPASEHRINPRSSDGLLDLAALGNLLELLPYLDRRYYTGDIPPSEEAEIEYARLAFSSFKSVFCAHQHLRYGTRRVDPMTQFFRLSLLQFSVTLVRYKMKKLEFDGAFTPLELRQQIENHLAKFHQSLSERFIQDVQRPQEDLPYLRSFDWTNTNFVVSDGPYIDTISLDKLGPKTTGLSPCRRAKDGGLKFHPATNRRVTKKRKPPNFDTWHYSVKRRCILP